jgi:RNA-directed DNA polymerase
VLGFFSKDQNFALSANVATVIARIACQNNELPQGIFAAGFRDAR